MSAAATSPTTVAAGGRAAIGPVVWAMVQRSVLATVRIPASFVPMVVMPLFFVVAFGGAFSAVTLLPGFPTDNVLDWVAPFAVLQGASFAGFGTAFGTGRDLENGFFDRLLAAPVPRLALLLGALGYSAVRAVVPTVIVVTAVVLGGATLPGGPLAVVVLAGAAVGVALAAGLWGLGVVYRARTQRAGGLVQVGIFAAMFLSVGLVPLSQMEGTWLYWVARLNPVSAILAMARSGFLGEVTWSDLAAGLAALAVLFVVLGVFAWRGLRRLED
jgi:ABC-type multidrug transport system permease subunit